MSAIGTGYDLSATTFSPDGRIFQTEYATKAVENSGTCVGLRCRDGVVLGVEKLLHSRLLVRGTNRRIGSIDLHAGIAAAGLIADGRHIIERARAEAKSYRSFYQTKIPAKILAKRVGQYMQAHTVYSSVRPFGCSALVAAVDQDGPQLYLCEPSGSALGYFGYAIGKGRHAAKTEIEKLNLKTMTCREAVFQVARIIHSIHDDVKDKEFELEMSWICPESNNQHEFVPADVQAEAERVAEAAIEEAEMRD